MKKVYLYRLTAILVVIIVLASNLYSVKCSAVQVVAVPDKKVPEIVAEYACVMEANTGKVLYNKNMNTKAYPASITKIMTALLAFENGNLEDIVTYSYEAVFSVPSGYVNAGLAEGDTLTLEQSLYAALLPSANDACAGIAEYVAGSIKDFVIMMNERAKELGANNTNFVNSNGIHDDNHYTTAYDMALIMSEAIKNTKFREIIATKSYHFPATSINDVRTLKNTNELINEKSKYYNPYVIGSKTGYTAPAKRTLVSYAKVGNLDLIVVLLKGGVNEVFDDTNVLINYFENAFETKIIKPTDLKEIVVPSTFNQSEDTAETEIIVKANDELKYIDYVDNAIARIEYDYPEVFSQQLKKGDIVGCVSVYFENEMVAYSNLIVDSYRTKMVSTEKTDVKAEDDKHKTSKIMKVFKIVIIAIGVVVVLLFIYAQYLQNKRRRRMRNKWKNRNR